MESVTFHNEEAKIMKGGFLVGYEGNRMNGNGQLDVILDCKTRKVYWYFDGKVQYETELQERFFEREIYPVIALQNASDTIELC